jgi:predicted rRNA methylase YqxC with S4 and FtsJ domains
MTQLFTLTRRRLWRPAWLLTSLLSLLAQVGYAQAPLYYTLNDGNATSSNDQLRRVNADGTGDVLVKSGFVQSAGTAVVDVANNRVLVADVRVSQPATSLTNTKIVAVSLTTGNAVSTLVTPAYLTGSPSTAVSGLALDAANNYLYYTLNDGDATASNDQLRRVNLNGTGDVLLKSGFVQSAGPLVLDVANNRVLVADVRVSQPATSLTNTKIVAVSLAAGNAVSTLVTPAYLTGSTSTAVSGLALDAANNYLYYTLNDGNATSSNDQLRRVNADGTSDVLLKSGFVQSAGTAVVDVANNRVLVADVRVSQPATTLTNTKVVAVSLATGNAASTLVTPAYLTGSPSTAVNGLALPAVLAPAFAITTGPVNPLGCAGAALAVPFTVAGDFASGNVFSAQLSDANGSFTSPVIIGTLASTSSGTIAATLPATTPAGSGYRVRVVSSAPAVTGTPSSTPLTVNAAPTLSGLPNQVVFTTPGTCTASVSLAASATGTPAPTLSYTLNGAPIPSPYAFPVGVNTVTVTATNSCGTATGTFTVTVVDREPPIVRAAGLQAGLLNGTRTLEAADIDYGSYDNCGAIASLSISPRTFTCANLGSNQVTLTVTDNAGNSASQTVTVLIVDNTAPVVLAAGLQVNLVNGTRTIEAADIDYGSYDECGAISSLTLDRTTFTCANVGPNQVTLTVTDNAGNKASQTVTVVVVDNTAPVLRVAGFTAQLQNGTRTIEAADIDYGSYDECGSLTSLSISPRTFTCANVGPNQVTITATDQAGNVSSQVVTVLITADGTCTPAVAASPSQPNTLEAYPNPARAQATLRFTAQQTGTAQLQVYNTLGELVATLYNGVAAQGQVYERTLGGTNLPAGLYTCRFTQQGKTVTQRVVLTN